jgi:hypothetical protein
MSTQDPNRPVHTIRHGRIKAAIWANQTQKGVMHNVTFTRSYQDDQGNWFDTQSFGVSDLMTVAKCAFDAHSWISAQKAEDESNSTERKNERSTPARKAPQRPSAAVH